MTQGPLPFEYQFEQNSTGLTSFAGLPVFLDLMQVMGFASCIRKHLQIRPTQGWSDVQQITAMVCLHLAGGDSIEDLNLLEADQGFCHIIKQAESYGLRARQRKALHARWRIKKQRAVPSPDSALRYLECFDDHAQSAKIEVGKAYVPSPNTHLQGLARVLAETCAFAQLQNPEKTATLDQDATLIESHKREAMFTYKGFKGFQPLNVFWHEQGLMLASEFRPGNGPAAWRNLDVFSEALDHLPNGVRQVRARMDTAGYCKELLKYMAEGKNTRFGVIEFAIGVDISQAFKQAVAEVKQEQWHSLYHVDATGMRIKTEQEYAEVCFVPNWVGRTKHGPIYRFLAIRQPIENTLPGFETEQRMLPFATWSGADGQSYKLSGIVTNIDAEKMDGQMLIDWHRERCGASEHVHGVLKRDLGAGRMPSAHFGANAAWWHIGLIACNFHIMMQRLVFGQKGLGQRLKAVRFQWLNIAGRVITHARKTVIRIAANHPAKSLLSFARRKILAMATGPPIERPVSD